MSKTGRYNYRRPAKGRNRPAGYERHISVQAVSKNPPDYQKLSRAIIAMELAKIEDEKNNPTLENTSDEAAQKGRQ
ncbi:hypothetical protein [Nocardia bovistercoris]|uniref:Uncharacterized protein n=1 Tax=Nocardia bovistercoris TaxID=2785916 RepID=A0A931IED7_9NOCA|nr:hypothetical protein [Nocardia bovistercoris]MBH0779934.1 hypothetical protein [Nocardia bovistercoris]